MESNYPPSSQDGLLVCRKPASVKDQLRPKKFPGYSLLASLRKSRRPVLFGVPGNEPHFGVGIPYIGFLSMAKFRQGPGRWGQSDPATSQSLQGSLDIRPGTGSGARWDRLVALWRAANPASAAVEDSPPVYAAEPRPPR